MSSSSQSAADLLRPSKYLVYSEDHFAGYFIQLDTYIRSNSDAEELLTGLLVNPLLELVSSAGAPAPRSLTVTGSNPLG